MQEYLIKVVILGDRSVGKSTLLKNYHENEKNVEPTIGVDFIMKKLQLKRKELKFHIWDTSGNTTFLNIIKTYLKGCNAGIIVFRLDDFNSFLNIDFWISEFFKEGGRKPLIFVGTHADKIKQIMIEAINEKCNFYGAEYFEISNLVIHDIDNILVKIGDKVLKENLEVDKSPPFLTNNMDYVLFEENEDNSLCKRCNIL